MADENVKATEEKVEIPKKFEKLVKEIEELSVLELSELVKVLEDHFGVSAAAPAVAVAAGMVLGLASYAPRMIYFVLLAILVAIIVFHRYEARMHKVGALAGLIVMLIILTPIGLSLYLNPAQLADFFGTPDLAGALGNLSQGFSDLAWKASLPDYLNLTNLALLNIVELGLAALGILVILTDVRAPRGWLIAGTTLLSAALIAIVPISSINIYIFLPLVAVLASIGLFTLWTRWREIFPKNQAARGLAITALAVVVAFSS